MATPILSVITPEYLIAAGVALIAIEAVIFSFVVFWFGLATVIVGVLSYLFPFNDGLHQLVAIALIAMVLLITLRAKVLERFMKAKGKDHDDDFLNEEGEGIIENGKVYFKATYWKIDSSESFEEGEKVKVLSTKGASAKVLKIYI